MKSKHCPNSDHVKQRNCSGNCCKTPNEHQSDLVDTVTKNSMAYGVNNVMHSFYCYRTNCTKRCHLCISVYDLTQEKGNFRWFQYEEYDGRHPGSAKQKISDCQVNNDSVFTYTQCGVLINVNSVKMFMTVTRVPTTTKAALQTAASDSVRLGW